MLRRILKSQFLPEYVFMLLFGPLFVISLIQLLFVGRWHPFISLEITIGSFALFLTAFILYIKGIKGISKLRELLYRAKMFLWYYLIIRCNEFHWSLDIDLEKALRMTIDEYEKYQQRLIRFRQYAHERSLGK